MHPKHYPEELIKEYKEKYEDGKIPTDDKKGSAILKFDDLFGYRLFHINGDRSCYDVYHYLDKNLKDIHTGKAITIRDVPQIQKTLDFYGNRDPRIEALFKNGSILHVLTLSERSKYYSEEYIKKQAKHVTVIDSKIKRDLRKFSNTFLVPLRKFHKNFKEAGFLTFESYRIRNFTEYFR